jgi:hypothetical protein
MSGQTVSGNYIFRDGSSSNYSVSYCDFSKSITDLQIQKRIGKVDVTDKPPRPDAVMFHASRTSGDSGTNYIKIQGRISFTKIDINHGGGMLVDGTFTAPRAGEYIFFVSGTGHQNHVQLRFKHKTNQGILQSYTIYKTTKDNNVRTLSKTIVLTLGMGDVVHIENDRTDNYGFISVGEDTPFTFSGYRLPT